MVNVGLIGCGFMGKMHANVYRQLNNANLLGVFDHQPQKGAAFASEFGCHAFSSIEEMLAHPEISAVDICLPTFLHAEATIKAAQAGKHVICEKPMALNEAEADAMIEACEKANVQLMIGHCIRFWPEYAYLKDLVDSGTLGPLRSVNLTRYGEFPSWSSENWLANPQKSGGGVLDMHIHDTDFAHYLLGNPDNLMTAGTIDEKGPSQVFTTMTFGDVIVHLEGGWNLPEKTPFKMAFRAIFANGAAIMDGGPLTIYQNGADPKIPEFTKMEAAGGGNISDLGGYYVELKAFVDALESGNKVTTVTPASSKQSLATVLKEIELMKRGNHATPI